METKDPNKPGPTGFACAGIGAIILIVCLILHAYAAFSPYFDAIERVDYEDFFGHAKTDYHDHHDQRDAIAIPATVLEALVSFVAVVICTSSFAERTATSLLAACLALGLAVLGLVLGGARNWPAATWLLSVVAWLAFALELGLAPLGRLAAWAGADGPRRLLRGVARRAARVLPLRGRPDDSEVRDAFLFAEIPASPSRVASPTLVGSPRHPVSTPCSPAGGGEDPVSPFGLTRNPAGCKANAKVIKQDSQG